MAKQDLTASIALSPRSLSRLGMFVDYVAQATGESVETVRRKVRSYDGLRELARLSGAQGQEELAALVAVGQQHVDAGKLTRAAGPKRRIVGKAPAALKLASEADARILLARVANENSRAMVVIGEGVRAQLERFRFSEAGKAHSFRVTRRKTVWSKDPKENEKITAAWDAAVSEMRPVAVEGGPEHGFVAAVVWPTRVAAVLVSADPLQVGIISNQHVKADADDLSERIAGDGLRSWGGDGPFGFASGVAVGAFAKHLAGVLPAGRSEYDRRRALERVLEVRGQAAGSGALRDLTKRLPEATAKVLRAINGRTQSGRAEARKVDAATERAATSASAYDPFASYRFVNGVSAEDARRILQGFAISRGVLAAFDARSGYQKGASEIREGIVAGKPMREIGRQAARAAMEAETCDPRVIRNIMVDGCLDRSILERANQYYRSRPKAPKVDPRALMLQSFGFDKPSNAVGKAALEGALRVVEGEGEFVTGASFKKARDLSTDYQDMVQSFEKSARAIGVPGPAVRAIARSIAYPEGIKRKGMQELSALWHREAPHVEARKAALIEETMLAAGLTPPEAFPHVLEKPVEIDGVRFTPLRSARELVAEGKAMEHCVGSYADPAERGERMIAVVECAAGRSTADFRFSENGDLYLNQNRSIGNSAAAPEADAAARKLIGLINDREATKIEGVRDLVELRAVVENASRAAGARSGRNLTLEQRAQLADLEFDGLKPFLSKPERLMSRDEWLEKAVPARIADLARSYERKAGVVRQAELALAV